MTDETFNGKCACGHVTYRMTHTPLFVHCCHCRSCQRETGTAFALNALIESEHVELTGGATETIDTPSASGKGQKIVRCSKCKVAVWSHYGGMGEKASFIRVGTLEDPDRFPPDIHIFTSSKQPWVTLAKDGAPVVEEYYSAKQYWPADSLARRDALFAK
jgi:hypothetical protein